MDNSLKGLMLAAGTIITCIVISLGFYIAREARDTATNGANSISKLNAEFNESDKSMYDGLEVSGNEVLNVIHKFEDEDMGIRVTNSKRNTTCYNYTLTEKDGIYNLGSSSEVNVKNAQKTTEACYINPNAQFLGSILRDENKTIIGIDFNQVK